MISVEAYRASIGRFYTRAKLLSSGEDNSPNECFCAFYETRMCKEHDVYDRDTLRRIYDYFGERYKELEIEIESCNETNIAFYQHLFDCYDKILEVVESYDASFLKVLKLLIDGDVESNPGPVSTNVETPKGRGRPKKAPRVFKGIKPKRLDFTSSVEHGECSKHPNEAPSTSISQIDANTTMTTLLNIDYSLVTRHTVDSNFPVRLHNEGVNVCFFNSICQVLYSLPEFHTYLEQTPISHLVVTELKNLFETMRGAI